MTKLKTFKTGFILFVLLFSIITFIPITEKTKADDGTESSRLISFNSYMDLSYDITPLNDPLAIDVSVTIPITVHYWTNIPDFFRAIPFPINYIILYGQSIGPMQKIHLEVLNTPDWANIYITSPDVLTDIPFHGDGRYEIDTNLVLSPRVEAPAVSYKIDVKATCSSIKRLNGFSYQESIEFTPSFIPTIEISIDNPTRTVAPHTAVNFDIKVRNLGNKITRVTPTLKLSEDASIWTPTINPPNFEINSNSENTFTFSIIAPFDFGWHNKFQSFEIEFLSEVYPYRTASPTSAESIYLVVNNYGFSLPGFEFSILIISMIVIGIIIHKRRIK
jgi:hypothetical protein